MNPSMLIFITGEDTFRSREFLREQVEKFKKTRDPQSLNIAFVDAQKIETEVLFAQLFAPPFLGQKRLVVVENMLASGHSEMLVRFRETLQAKRFPESSVIIVWHDGGKSKLKEVNETLKLLEAEPYVYRFDALGTVELAKWVYERAQKAGGHIDEAARRYLADNAEDTWQLANILDQLVVYSNGAPITVADAELFLGQRQQTTVFAFAEAVAAGQKKTAFSLLGQLRAAGEEDGYLFSMVVREYRIWLQISSCIQENAAVGAEDVARALKIHPFVAKKTLPKVKTVSYDFLLGQYQKLLQTDIGIKTGFLPIAWLLELLVAHS